LLNDKLSLEIKGSALIGKTKFEQSWRLSGLIPFLHISPTITDTGQFHTEVA